MLTRLRALALRRGVFGDSRPFLAVWIVLAGVRLLKWIAGNEREVVYRAELAPGERLVIDHTTETRG